MTIRLTLVAAFAALAAACGGGSDAYTVEEVRAAFETEGYELVEPPPDPAGFALNPWGTGEHVELAPRGGAAFRVYIGESAAAEATAGDGPEFGVRRANVLVLSSGPLAATHRTRIRTALEGLPDRGGELVVVRAG